MPTMLLRQFDDSDSSCSGCYGGEKRREAKRREDERREAKRRETSHLILIPYSWISRREHFSYPKMKNILALKKASKIAVMLKNILQLWVLRVFPSPHAEQYQFVPKFILSTSSTRLLVPT
jgi:hypothetical protein